MQNSELLLGQEAYRIGTKYAGVLASYRLRGIETTLFMSAHEGNPQGEANIVPRNARAFVPAAYRPVAYSLLNTRFRLIDNLLSGAKNPAIQTALRLLNEKCQDLVIMGVWKRRKADYHVLEPDLVWVSAPPLIH